MHALVDTWPEFEPYMPAGQPEAHEGLLDVEANRPIAQAVQDAWLEAD